MVVRGTRALVPALLLLAALGACGGAAVPPDPRSGADAGPDLIGDDGGVAPPLTGTWAVKATLQLETMVLGRPEQVTSVLVLRGEIEDDGTRVVLRATPCDFRLPQVPGFDARLVVPPALLATVGELVSEGTRTGRTLSGARQLVTLGVVLADPASSPLPAPPETPQLGDCASAEAGSYCDQELDQRTGATLLFDPPFNARVLKLGRIYAAARTVVTLGGTITPDGSAIVGTVPAADIRLDTQVLGCQKCEVNDSPRCDAPEECTATDIAAVAALNPTVTPVDGSELVAVRLFEPLDCDEIVAQQGGLFR